MIDISIVQRLVTWTVIFLLIVTGILVLFQKNEVTPTVITKEPVPTSGPAPIPVYPNNGKE